MDPNRLKQFHKTKEIYDSFPQKKEIIIPTRHAQEIEDYLTDNDLIKDVRLIPYRHDDGFNPSKAFNIGVRSAEYDNIIITSPEVMPLTNVLEQLSELLDQNVVCQVWDQNENGERGASLVSTKFRNDTPGFYFLAMFRKEDLQTINGWDEEFMKGYAFEDNDFGSRWNRASLPFIIRDDIQAIHQYHPRGETIVGGWHINNDHYEQNNVNGVIRPKNGLMIQ